MGGQSTPIPQSSSHRVLILDVDEVLLMALERVLEEAGLHTATTWSPQEAYFWVVERKRFDLMVLGDHPPEIDAFAILGRLQSLRRLVPCIVMHTTRELSDEPKWNGLITTLSGCDPAEILEQVQEHLRRSAAETTRQPTRSSPMSVAPDRPAPALPRCG